MSKWGADARCVEVKPSGRVTFLAIDVEHLNVFRTLHHEEERIIQINVWRCHIPFLVQDYRGNPYGKGQLRGGFEHFVDVSVN